MAPSLCRGAVRLIPNVKGVPLASKLRPITLLNTDYKLLSKVLVGRLMQVLTSILRKGQLCSVKGRNIMQGAIFLWSTAEFMRQTNRRGFLLNLDFYHAYDRVCLPYVDRVLGAMWFGETFREVVAVVVAQILPLPQAVAAKAKSLASAFLWGGHGESLAWQELHNRREEGGLAVSCVFTRGQALLAKQMCLQVAAGGSGWHPGCSSRLLAWFGGGHFVPSLAAGSHSPRPPAGLMQAAEVLVDMFSHGTVPPGGLATARAAAIYRVFTNTPLLPRSGPSGPGTGVWSGEDCGVLGCLRPCWTRCSSSFTTCCPSGAGWPPWAWWLMAAALTVGPWRLMSTSSSSAPAFLG